MQILRLDKPCNGQCMSAHGSRCVHGQHMYVRDIVGQAFFLWVPLSKNLEMNALRYRPHLVEHVIKQLIALKAPKASLCIQLFCAGTVMWKGNHERT